MKLICSPVKRMDTLYFLKTDRSRRWKVSNRCEGTSHVEFSKQIVVLYYLLINTCWEEDTKCLFIHKTKNYLLFLFKHKSNLNSYLTFHYTYTRVYLLTTQYKKYLCIGMTVTVNYRGQLQQEYPSREVECQYNLCPTFFF